MSAARAMRAFIDELLDALMSWRLPPFAGLGPRPIGSELSEPEVLLVDETLARERDVSDEARWARWVDTLWLVARWRGFGDPPIGLDPEAFTEPDPEAYRAQHVPEPYGWTLGILQEIAVRQDEFDAATQREFGSLGSHVRTALAANAGINGATTAIGSYRSVRARLWLEGWRDAAAIFTSIVPPPEHAAGGRAARLCGRPIQNGIHVDALDEIERLGLAGAGTGTIREANGFQPRRIAGEEKLSNHVWGYAVDVDPSTNPRGRPRRQAHPHQARQRLRLRQALLGERAAGRDGAVRCAEGRLRRAARVAEVRDPHRA